MSALVSRILVAAGLLSIVAGTLLYSAGSPGGPLTAALLAAAAALIVAAALVNRRALIAFSKKRAARRGANAVLVTAVFLSILVMIQAISIRNTARYDVTSNKRFTPSEQTSRLLSGLDDRVTITAFFRDNTVQRFYAENLLGMYSNESKNIRYEVIDPDRKPMMAERMGARAGETVIEYRNNRRTIDDLSEEKLTNAIYFATHNAQKAVYFVTGHDEKYVEGTGRSGFSEARSGLTDMGYVVYELSLLDVDSIPGDCAVLVLAGPTMELLDSEVRLIDAYLMRGGNALFLFDPRRPVGHMNDVLERYHIELPEVVLLDEMSVENRSGIDFDHTFTKIRFYDKHRITRDFRSITIFPMARPVAVVPVEGDISVSAQYLAITGKSAWGETDMTSFTRGSATRDAEDIAPPLAVAAVSERTNRFDAPAESGPGGSAREVRSRIVVVGDSDFITNRFYRVLGNSDFFLNIVEFLAEEEIVIPVRLKKGLRDTIYITAAEGRFIFASCLVLLPLMVMSFGGYVYLRKRKSRG